MISKYFVRIAEVYVDWLCKQFVVIDFVYSLWWPHCWRAVRSMCWVRSLICLTGIRSWAGSHRKLTRGTRLYIHTYTLASRPELVLTENWPEVHVYIYTHTHTGIRSWAGSHRKLTRGTRLYIYTHTHWHPVLGWFSQKTDQRYTSIYTHTGIQSWAGSHRKLIKGTHAFMHVHWRPSSTR